MYNYFQKCHQMMTLTNRRWPWEILTGSVLSQIQVLYYFDNNRETFYKHIPWLLIHSSLPIHSSRLHRKFKYNFFTLIRMCSMYFYLVTGREQRTTYFLSVYQCISGWAREGGIGGGRHPNIAQVTLWIKASFTTVGMIQPGSLGTPTCMVYREE